MSRSQFRPGIGQGREGGLRVDRIPRNTQVSLVDKTRGGYWSVKRSYTVRLTIPSVRTWVRSRLLWLRVRLRVNWTGSSIISSTLNPVLNRLWFPVHIRKVRWFYSYGFYWAPRFSCLQRRCRQPQGMETGFEERFQMVLRVFHTKSTPEGGEGSIKVLK